MLTRSSALNVAGADLWKVSCPACGRFDITSEMIGFLETKPEVAERHRERVQRSTADGKRPRVG